ncbi:MAG TPA: hypothetical protein VMS17_13960 [Gemmataceae bacterium]|nr:hypothetical protein [Gemmataceae bacterium]
MYLKKFEPSQLVLSNQQAWQVLQFFYDGNAGCLPSMLTDDDRSFAQALLLEAVDESYAESWIEATFGSAMDVNPDVKDILKDLAKKAATDWLKSSKPADLEHAKIYGNVKSSLMMQTGAAWKTHTNNRTASPDSIYDYLLHK